MYLKRLEVVGFKSFAEKMSIEFDKGVTAVVGPNGSGKSNISDGIRWVLGEQSAKSLRGSKMEDIIFAGSDTRKALNFAEITLVLDNEDQYLAIDYMEVSVTRRVYRSGESEYMLNKQPCRLKDIVDLFMDSGLGREAYSIIGQGKVEEILSSKGEDRRVIFEDAAGVLKYKTRKIKAEKKLIETQDNLNRVEDIIYELEGQIEPLQMQASITKDYLEKKQALQEVEVSLMAHDIHALHQKWTEYSEKLRALEERKTDLKEKISVNERKGEGFKEKLRSLEKAMNELQQELLEASEELEKREGQKEVLKERKKNFYQNKEQAIKTVNELKAKKQSVFEKVNVEEEKLKEIEKTIQQLNKDLKDKSDFLVVASEDLEAELERLKSDYIEVLNEQASLRNEKRYVEEQITSLEKKRTVLVANNENLLEQRNSLKENKNSLLQSFQEKEDLLNSTVSSYRKLQEQLEKENNEYQKRQAQLYEAYRLVQQVRSRKDVMEEMQADFSGFFQGVKEVLKARNNQLRGIIGAIAELVTVPKEYETALEISLGGAAQHIVVEEEVHGRQAIQFLKKHGYGRATFLPLPVIKGRFVRQEHLQKVGSHPAFVGVAANLIEYDNRYGEMINNLLGNVIIAHHLEGANELAKLVGYSYRIVTLEGDVVNPGGSMTGGAIKQKGNQLLGRQRELEELEAKLTDMEEKTSKLELLVKKLKETIAEKERALKLLQADGEKARQAHIEAKNRLQELEIEERSLNERLSLFDREQEALQKEQELANRRISELTEELHQLATATEILEKQVQEIENKIKLQQSSKENVQSEVTDLKIQLAKEEERRANQKETIQRLAMERDETASKLEEMEMLYWEIENEMSENTTGEQTLEEKITFSRQRKDNIVNELNKRRLERGQMEEEFAKVEQEEKEQNAHLALLLDELHQCEVQVTRLDVALDKQLEHLRNEYELSYEAAKEQYPLQMEPEEARTKVKLIKLAIEELGNVNLGAIEEYERVNERFQFLQEQRNDLVEAKQTLHTVINEMDEEMTKRFKGTFDQIRYHFQIVFKKLFGGGEADLILTNPEELLTTGVEIMARPPGKKLQNLALLSGGERALTAIALLFAILNVRPVPFCVLDEVEAALDEANVSRFASYLKTFSEETQFIVITHRKGTMEEADVLYGVTMQESGVSKLVSVRLEETKELMET